MIAPLKQVPQQKNIPNVQKIREIDLYAPIIYRNGEIQLPQITKQKKKKDKRPLQRKAIAKMMYNSEKQQIITIGRLSSSIYFYNLQLQAMRQIQPKTYKDVARQIAILSIAFNDSYQRIGAIINGIGIAFWQAADNYQTQKTISKYQGDKIYYLNLFQQWITTDKTTIYFWDLKNQIIHNKITYQESIFINDICQINHLRCLCVSYTTKNDEKLLIVYRNMKPIIKYSLGSAGSHSLYYNISTQMMISAGYHNFIQVYDIQNDNFSMNLKKQLRGHTSIVNCICDIKNTNFLISADDSGQVRIWQLNFMKCIQVIKLSKWVGQIYCTGSKLIFSDSRLNVIQMDKFNQNLSLDDNQIIATYYNDQYQGQYIVTRKSIRFLNIYNGKVQKIYFVCDQDQQISSSIDISTGILIGTSKGKMKLYSTDGKFKWQIQAHQGQIHQLKYDKKARFIFSLANDNKFYIWPQNVIKTQGYKKLITFKTKHFNNLAIYQQVRVVIISSMQENQLIFWDYQNWKLLTIIKLNSPVNILQFNSYFKLLIIHMLSDQIYFIKLNWFKNHLCHELIYKCDNKLRIISQNQNGQNKLIKHTNESKIILKDITKQKKLLEASPKQTPQKNSSNFLLTQTNNEIVIDSKTKLKQKNQNIGKKYENERQNSTNKKGIKFNVQQNARNSKNESITTSKNCSLKCIKQEIKQQNNENKSKKNLKLSKKVLGQKLGEVQQIVTSEILTKIIIKQTQFGTFLIIGNSKGQIKCFNISQVINIKIGMQQKCDIKRQSPSLYRPSKQQFQIQLQRNKHQTIHINKLRKNISVIDQNYFKQIWNYQFKTKQSISSFGFIQMKKTYISIASIDGYYKIFNLQTGQIDGGLRMNLPLPMIWNVKIQKNMYIRKNVYQTLMILDKILTNNGFQMLSKQYKSINITRFLEMLSTFNVNIEQKQNKSSPKKQIHLLHQEYTIQDLKGIKHKQSTIPELQAYKRVKIIKQKMKQSNDFNNGRLNEQQNRQKQTVQFMNKKQDLGRLLSPSYFSILKDQGVSNKLNRSIELGSIQDKSNILLDKIKQKKKYNDDYLKNKASIIQEKVQEIKKTNNLQLPLIENKITSRTVLDTRINSSINAKINKQNYLSIVLAIPSTIRKSESVSNLKTNASFIQSTNINLNNLLNISTDNASTITTNTKIMNQQQSRKTHLNTKRFTLDDKPVKQILCEINDKLNKYKKLSYAKRSLI